MLFFKIFFLVIIAFISNIAIFEISKSMVINKVKSGLLFIYSHFLNIQFLKVIKIFFFNILI